MEEELDLNRQSLIKEISFLALDKERYSKQQNEQAIQLLAELTAKRIDESVAYDRYQSILNANSGYWSDKYKSKVVYESLQKYQQGKLNNIATAKMVSSLITHALIEMELNESATLDDMGVKELAGVLQNMLNSELNESCSDMLNPILYRYGYLEDKKEGD